MTRAHTWAEVAAFTERRLGPYLGHPVSVGQVAVHPTRPAVAGVAEVRTTALGPAVPTVTLFEDGGHTSLRAGSSPAWSPDGTVLAHLTGTGVQVGEWHRELSGIPEVLDWKADSSALVVLLAAHGSDVSALGGSGVTSRTDQTWLPEVTGGTPAHGRRAVLVDASTGAVTPVGRADLNVWDVRWAGEQLLAVCSDADPTESAWFTADLRLVDPATGADEVLVRPAAQLGPIGSSPSGDRIGYVSSVASDRGLVAGDLLVLDRRTGVTTRWADGVDVSSFAFVGEDELGFAGLTGLVTRVGRATSDGARELWSSEELSTSGYHPTAAFAAERSAWVAQGFRQGPHVVLDGQVLADLDRTAPETGTLRPHRWAAPDGQQVEGWLHLPDGPGPHPLVVVVHGGPVACTRSTWTPLSVLRGHLVEQGHAVLMPNPRGSTGRGQSWTSAVVGDMGGADALDITSGVASLVDVGLVDRARVGVTGGSYGGFMTAWLVTQTDLFAAAVAQFPICDWRMQHGASNIAAWDELFLDGKPYAPDGQYVSRSPLAQVADVRTPTLFLAGALDRATPPGQAVAMHRALLAHGVPSECALYPESGHGSSDLTTVLDLTARTAEWFARHLPAPAEGA